MDLDQMYRSAEGAKAIAAAYRRLLRRWPPTHQPVRFVTGLGQAFAMRSGVDDGPAVVMLHGSGSNGAVWMGVSAELGRIARTYALDLPGEPGNSAAVRCNWSGMVAWLGEVRRQIPERPLVLLGNSLGGWLAMASAAADPAGVAAVMTICPAGICPRRSSYKWHALAARWAGKRGPRVMERVMLRGQKMDDEFREFFDLASRYFLYRPSVPLLSDEDLRRIPAPLGYWAGRKDILLPTKKIAARLRSLIPSASIFIDKKGGHGFHPSASELREWLAETLSLPSRPEG